MKNKLILLLLLFCTSGSEAATRVRGHINKRGKYVKPHFRSSADSTRRNNWSTKGNTNPFTGKRGQKNP